MTIVKGRLVPSYAWYAWRVAAMLACFGASGLQAQTGLPSHPPSLGGTPAFALPAVREWRLDNGLTIWLVPMRGVSLIDVSLVVRGDAESSEEHLASIVAATLRDGAGANSKEAIAQRLATSGIAFESRARPDATTLAMHASSTTLPDALALLADLVIRPRLAAADVARRRAELAARVAAERSESPALADRTLACVVYGSAHKYVQSTNAETATLVRLTSGRARAYHQSRYRPDRVVLIIAGDFDAETVRILVEREFGSWTASQARAAERHTIATKRACPGQDVGGVRMVHVPGAAQASLRVGSLAVGQGHENAAGYDVLAALLGGPFTSRLHQALRERSGFSYGADAELASGPIDGILVMRSEADPAKADSALALFRAELERARNDLSETDVLRGRQFVAFGLAESMSTSRGQAARLSAFAGSGHDALSRYAVAAGKATLAGLTDLAGRTLAPERLHFVVAGDTTVWGARVRALERRRSR